jgi:quercetin dioxygenase-like cupin family protein
MKKTTPSKQTIVTKCADVNKADNQNTHWMTENEFTRIIVGKVASNSEYVISDGVLEPGGFVPDHYHKWEDQTFHIIEGELEAKIGDTFYQIGIGDSIHCPRGTSHFMKNIGKTNVKLISYIFPRDWAEDFFTETSRQVKTGEFDFKLIEEQFGVVYL